jgi:hypothetical protein
VECSKSSTVCRTFLEFVIGPIASENVAGMCNSPFRDLPTGAMTHLFWASMGLGKDTYIFQNFGVYPFDRLNDAERIAVLAEVAEAMSGYRVDLRCNVLNESALFTVFAVMKARVKKECDDACADRADRGGSWAWRNRILSAFEQVRMKCVCVCVCVCV